MIAIRETTQEEWRQVQERRSEIAEQIGLQIDAGDWGVTTAKTGKFEYTPAANIFRVVHA